jgi:hypothetical protein
MDGGNGSWVLTGREKSESNGEKKIPVMRWRVSVIAGVALLGLGFREAHGQRPVFEVASGKAALPLGEPCVGWSGGETVAVLLRRCAGRRKTLERLPRVRLESTAGV